ncbi:MAG TPA: arginine deiminase family protein [Vicinamibacterales bacterium]
MPSEVEPLTSVVLKHARDAFVDNATIAAQWKDLRFAAPPDFARAIDEYDAFLALVQSSGAAVRLLPRDARTTLDSIYVRDASIVCSRGVILGSMGKPQRAREPETQEAAFARLPSTPVIGAIQPPGRLEGGDVVWLDDRTVVIGRGYRTNDEGIRQLRTLLDGDVEIIVVALPHWRGVQDVMHLMSLVSPVDRDVALVYSPLLPVPFRELLLHRGIDLVEVPDEEFETMGTNVLALAPGRCLMLAGNPRTRSALERAGVDVVEYVGQEISVKGAGGPTCLTRPLARTG